MNKRMSYEQARKTMERAYKMESEFGEYFTGEWKMFPSLFLFCFKE